ncbi:MAG: glycoside hydrolase family 2 protein [Roseburia sp.]|nr:glycoside hydrolase family 2 protein [Roseburia sp.]MCM1096643.1 glycoside hydrolase family 2 protein [Ruminococcus flavefaciens]
MNRLKVHENWRMRAAGEGDWIPARVPGSVYHDLLCNGRMEDPYYRDNELRALALMEKDYEYVTEFDVPAEVLAEERILLIFHGIDTAADIMLNGKHLGYVENMHRTWVYDVKYRLKEEGNRLEILLHSPTRFIREAYGKMPVQGSDDAMKGFPMLRKAHCMFGWDWGPRLPDAGIWRDVELLGYSELRIESVYITQEHEEGRVRLRLQAEVEASLERSVLFYYEVTVTDPAGESREYGMEAFGAGITVENPQLWWPNGYGEQSLYQVEVRLYSCGTLLDTWKRRIGLRTLTVHIEKDAYGEQFCHEVNGVRIFAMGGDYIPEDNILSRVTPERTRTLLQHARDAHFNCIRVWGGGNYPYDAFFDICDELGLIVWQDFMFACAVYDLSEKFEENITAEAIDNVKRIRHHACLGLWCGNNEMEMFIKSMRWNQQPKHTSDYVKMYEYILPKIVKQYDPNTFYWPASPSSGGAFDAPNDENRGDVHYWDVWHGDKPITEYRKFFFRYVSEFGFQSFPSLKTCETFTLPEDRNIFSYVMEKHQRNRSANGKIMNYMEQTFLYPGDFDTVLYASQLLQAEAIRYGVEHFRRHRGRCMGAIIWQLNDCWPVASWSSIDYCGRWKALHYYAKRFFAPLMLSCEEEGILTQNTNPNAEPYPVKKSIRLNVANEFREDRRVRVEWSLRNSRGEILRGGEETVTVPALSSVWLEKEDCGDARLYEDYVSFACRDARDGGESAEPLSCGTVLFCPPKHFRFEDPQLTVTAEGDELLVTAKAYAKSVEIINEADDLLLEDNYFDMNAGTRRIRILKGKAEGLKIRSVYDIR